MLNRSSSEIVPAILEACQGGARITTVIRKVNISHSQARSYLAELLQAGYLTLDAGEATIYTTTPDGLRYLHSNRVLLELLALV